MGCAASAPRAGASRAGYDDSTYRSEPSVAGAQEGGRGLVEETEAGGGSAELAHRLVAEGFALIEEDKVTALEDWVQSLVSLGKAKTGVQYNKRHVEALLVHVRKVLTQVAAELQWELDLGGGGDTLKQLLHLVQGRGAQLGKKLGGSWEAVAQEKKEGEEKRWKERRGWGAALAERGVEAAYERVVAGALYTHGMSCEKKKAGEACTHTDCDQQVSLYKVMNTAMRLVGEWGEKKEGEAVPAQHVHLLSAFQPLVVRLLGLQHGLPKNPQVVFRGITLNLSPQYKVGGQKVWHSFSSTSLVKGEAANFVAEGEQRGMMFAVATHTQAVDIDFANLYGERELLYAPNAVFNVAWKLSPTLLRMLGLQYDVVVLTEGSGVGAEAGKTELRLRALRDVMMHTVEFFDYFLSRYVEGRVTTGKQADEEETCPLSVKVRAWLSEEKSASGVRRPLCLVGGGGTGKTSAAVALMGWLLSEKRDGGDGLLPSVGRPVFPVFVPLPVLRMKKRGLLAEGGIDEYVRESFGLTDVEQKQLREDYDVVLVLDSLDEVGVGAREVVEAVKGGSLLSLHPWCASCSVVVTTRGEYLEAGGLVPAHVCGNRAEALYLQPFTHDDIEAYVRKVLGQGVEGKDSSPVVRAGSTDTGAGTAAKTVPEVLKALEDKALRGLVENPFVLHMAVAGRDSLPWMGGEGCGGGRPAPVMRVQVYETYLQQAVAQGLARLKLKEPPLKEDVLAVGELLGCWMLGGGAWAGTVEDVRRWLKDKDGDVTAGRLEVCLQCLPVRLESLEDEHGIFTFTHKAIGEYLAARRLWRASCTTLKKLLALRPFSKEAPNVLGFFAALRQQALCDGYKQAAGAVGGEGTDELDATLGQLLELVQASASETGQKDTCKEEESKVAASNAMSLLCHGGYTLPAETSLRGVVVCGADLRHLVLIGVDLTDAVLRDNWFDGSTLHSCDLTRTDWEGSSLGALVPPMRGHTSGVQAVAVTPDGRRIVSGSHDNTIRVWDINTGKEVMQPLDGCNGWVTALTLTPDGQRIVSGCYDNTIRVWDLETGKVQQTLAGHDGTVTTLAVTPDGRRVVSGSEDNTIRVWDIETGKVMQLLEGHTGWVRTLTLTPDGRRIVSGSNDNSIRVWDVETGKVMQTLEGHTAWVTTLALTPDGRRVVSGSGNTLRVWDLETGKVIQALEGHSGWVIALAVTPDGRRVVSGSDEKTIRVWDLETGKEVMQPLEGHTSSVCALIVTPTGRRVVSGSDDNTIRVWDLEAEKGVMQALEGHTDCVSSLTVAHDERKRVVSGSDDNTIRVWDLETGKEVMQALEGHSRSVTALAVTPDGRRVVSGSGDKTIRVWDLETGKEVMQPLEGHTAWVLTLAVTPDGRRVVSGGNDRTIRVWDLETGKVMQTLEGHTGWVRTLALTPDGRSIVSGSDDNTIRVWDLASGEEMMQPLEGHSTTVSAVTVTPDGSKIVSGSNDHTIRVWDIETGKEVMQPLEGHTTFVSRVTVTPDGRKIVSGSNDHTIRVWDIETGKEVTQPLEGHSGSVTALAVAPDGRRVVSGGSDKTIRVWDASTGALLAVLGVGPSMCRSVQCVGVESAEPDAQRTLLMC